MHVPLIGLATDILRLAIWFLLLLAVFVPLEQLFALQPKRIFRKSFSVDLGYYFLNSLLPKTLLAAPMALIAWGSHRLMPTALSGQVATLAPGARLAAAFIVAEIGFYWGHRWAHEIPWLWRFHAIHHSAEEIDWMVNTHAHPIDIAFVRLCGLVPLYALGLAKPMDGRTIDALPLLVMLAATMWGFFIHANLRWRFGWLESIVSTPAFHHWHHTNDGNIDKNYASMLPFLDRLFGTWHMPKGEWPAKYGIDAPVAKDIAGQLLQPLFRP